MKAKNLFQYILGALLVLGFFTLLIILIFVDVPEVNKELLNIVVGALIASFTAVVGYFYGSSLGSAEKNEMLRKNGKTD